MKLRFRENSLRLRLNQGEVASLASGQTLAERVLFPDGAMLRYSLVAVGAAAAAQFTAGVIAISIPDEATRAWATDAETGLYYELPGALPLKIAIEKDLACLDGPPEERDPLAYPRTKSEGC